LLAMRCAFMASRPPGYLSSPFPPRSISGTRRGVVFDPPRSPKVPPPTWGQGCPRAQMRRPLQPMAVIAHLGPELPRPRHPPTCSARACPALKP
jgi:hypothetical protein